jgi:integrase
LTAARTGETRLAKWREVDLAAREWTIPEERMKAGEEHTVPLSDAAFAILMAGLVSCPTDHGRSGCAVRQTT